MGSAKRSKTGEQRGPAFTSARQASTIDGIHGVREKGIRVQAAQEPNRILPPQLYSRRFTIEETFRDEKDLRFGMGLSSTHVRDAGRRDRLLLLGAMAHALLVLFGEAGERCGLDRTLKTNTSPKRQLSLYNQGTFWFRALPNMLEEDSDLLMPGYDEVIREHQFFREVYGVL